MAMFGRNREDMVDAKAVVLGRIRRLLRRVDFVDHEKKGLAGTP